MSDETKPEQPAATPSDASQVAAGTSSEPTIPAVAAPVAPDAAKSLAEATDYIGELEQQLRDKEGLIEAMQSQLDTANAEILRLRALKLGAAAEVTCPTCGTRCFTR